MTEWESNAMTNRGGNTLLTLGGSVGNIEKDPSCISGTEYSVWRPDVVRIVPTALFGPNQGN